MNLQKTYFEKLLGQKTYLSENDYKIYHTLFVGSIPSDAEVFLVFHGYDFITQRQADEVIQKKLFNSQLNVVEMFRCFDVDCKGYIDLTDLKRAKMHAASNLSWEILCNSFTDIVPHGMLDFESFKRLFSL